MTTPPSSPHILWFDEIRLTDIPKVGGKNASLGEMRAALTSAGVRVPDGFAVNAEAFRYFLRHHELDALIRKTLADLDAHDVTSLQERGRLIRQAMLAAPLPEDLDTADDSRHRTRVGGTPWQPR